MIDLAKLIDIPYLLDPRPTYNFAFFLPFLIFFSLSFVAGIVMSVVRKWQGSLWTAPVAQWLRWLGFSGLVLTFFRYEGIPFVSMRLFYYLLLLGFLAWLGVIVRNIRALKPKLVEQTIRQETYEKYLPRPKRKRA